MNQIWLRELEELEKLDEDSAISERDIRIQTALNELVKKKLVYKDEQNKYYPIQ